MNGKRTIEKPRRTRPQNKGLVTHPTHAAARPSEYFQDGYFAMHYTRTVVAAGLATALVLE